MFVRTLAVLAGVTSLLESAYMTELIDKYNPKLEGRMPYLYSSCWTFNDPFQCTATLIIVPDYCLVHWNQDVTTFSFSYILFMKINIVILISDTENS